MKTKTSYYLFFIIFLFLGSTLYSQEAKPPKPPVPDWSLFSKISKEREKKILQNYSKKLKQALKHLKQLNEKKYYEILSRRQFDYLMTPPLLNNEEEKSEIEREKKINELEVLTETLGAEYQSSNKNEKQKIINELRRKLAELFELKETNRKYEVEKLKQKLEKLEKALIIRMKNKNEIIKRRLEELIGEEDYLDW